MDIETDTGAQDCCVDLQAKMQGVYHYMLGTLTARKQGTSWLFRYDYDFADCELLRCNKA